VLAVLADRARGGSAVADELLRRGAGYHALGARRRVTRLNFEVARLALLALPSHSVALVSRTALPAPRTSSSSSTTAVQIGLASSIALSSARHARDQVLARWARSEASLAHGVEIGSKKSGAARAALVGRCRRARPHDLRASGAVDTEARGARLAPHFALIPPLRARAAQRRGRLRAPTDELFAHGAA
jgi:hypothetical protein